MSTKNVEEILEERGSRYGDFGHIAATIVILQETLFSHLPNLSPVQVEVLSQICTKMARAVHGDPNYPDNWSDIAGYANLALKEINDGLTKSAKIS